MRVRFALLCFAATASAATTLPAAAATMASPLPERAKTFEFAYQGRAAEIAGFGDNWNVAARYLHIVAPDMHEDLAVRAAGIRTLAYTDPNKCSGTGGMFVPYVNPYASPDCSTFPASAFYQDANGQMLTVGIGGSVTQALGNPASPDMQANYKAWVRQGVAASPVDLVEIDDASSVDEIGTGGGICDGFGTFVGGRYDCQPGNNAQRPWAADNHIDTWRRGEAALATGSPAQVVFNGLSAQTYPATESEAAITQVVVKTRNAWGAFCEGCFYNNSNPWVITGTILNGELRGIMDVVNAGKHALVLDSSIVDAPTRERALADLMLVFDHRYVVEGYPACGGASAISVCPEAAFVGTDTWYPRTLADLTDVGGAYVRRLAHCSIWGVDRGPCAAVVNPNLSANVPMPAGISGPTLAMSGVQICGAPQCAGTAGTVDFTGPQAPTVLAPATGYIVALSPQGSRRGLVLRR